MSKEVLKTELMNEIRKERFTILVIDDNDAFRQSLSFMLRRKYSAQVEVVNSGTLAIEAVQSGKSYDLIFTDLMMPGMKGTETFEGLRRIDPTLQIIIMSAYSDSELWKKAQALGARVIHKPIDENSLIEILSQSLRGANKELKELLIIEDDAKFRNIVKRALVDDGYSFFEASSIQGGLDICRERQSSGVILLDLELADGSGKEFLERLGPNISNYRIIVLTAHEEYLAAELAGEFQVFGYLHKPTRIMESLRFTVSQAFKDIEREGLKNKGAILTRKPIKVFISYTNPDFDKANWIYRRLKDNGFDPWMAQRDIRFGFDWIEQVKSAIDECDFVLSCLSDIAVKRLGYFQTETSLAIAKHDQVGGPFILPLRLDKCELPDEFVKRNIHYLDYDAVHDDWWLKLVETLKSKRT